MEYPLLKELKDAGFPQGTTEDANEYMYLDPKGNPCAFWAPEAAYVPTLSELIAECGNRFSELEKPTHRIGGSNLWAATAYPCEECGWNDTEIGTGYSSEEAVAKLWLALNKPETIISADGPEAVEAGLLHIEDKS